MPTKNKLLIATDWFYPGYKAGGPIQSITNLTIALEKEYEIAIITSGFDLLSTTAYEGIHLNQFNKITIPGSSQPVAVWYGDNGQPDLRRWLHLIKEINPHTIYLNGLFTPAFLIKPLLAARRSGFQGRLVICPRGMLQQGALSGKTLKKTLYLFFLRISGLLKTVHWHATDSTEKADIEKHFSVGRPVYLASNIPKKPVAQPTAITKQKGALRLIYLSLITEKKNLLVALQCLVQANIPVVFDICGPVKDGEYWETCKALISTLPSHIKVQYCGTVQPAEVQGIFAAYHALFLPTKGENFGHAIYECLSAGRSVIISNTTPWRELAGKRAGYDGSPEDASGFAKAICDLGEAEQAEFDTFCSGAYNVAVNYWKQHDFLKSYKDVFG